MAATSPQSCFPTWQKTLVGLQITVAHGGTPIQERADDGTFKLAMLIGIQASSMGIESIKVGPFAITFK